GVTQGCPVRGGTGIGGEGGDPGDRFHGGEADSTHFGRRCRGHAGGQFTAGDRPHILLQRQCADVQWPILLDRDEYARVEQSATVRERAAHSIEPRSSVVSFQRSWGCGSLTARAGRNASSSLVVRKLRVFGETGTSRTAATPFTVMVTSSPRRARSITAAVLLRSSRAGTRVMSPIVAACSSA